MTIIEFFNKTAIENILSALVCQPERVIYIGYSNRQMRAAIEVYGEVLRSRCVDTELSFVNVNRNDLRAITDALEKLVLEHDDCVFNLDGGEELYLVACGKLVERYPDRLQLHRFNVRNNTILDCDADGNDQQTDTIAIRVEENIRIYGGRVIFSDERPGTTQRWVFNEAFREDIRALWEVCRTDTRSWNRLVSTLGMLQNQHPAAEETPLTFRFPQNPHGVEKEDFAQLKQLLRSLAGHGLVQGLWEDAEGLRFTYKNQQILHILEKSGTALELYVTTVARGLIDDDERVYNDALSGVWLDWDGVSQPPFVPDVYNEVDVLLMHGATPVFISCKSGMMEVDELYKLSTVANRFGDKYARMALVTTSLSDLGDKGKYIRARAREMGITVVDDVDSLSERELERSLATLWRG